MKRRIVLPLAGLAAAIVLAGIGLPAFGSLAAVGHGSSSTTAAMVAAQAWHRCYVSDLSAGLHPQQPRTQNYGFILTLTNLSSEPCSLYGYPGLGLQNARHHVLSSHTFWGSTLFDSDPGRHLIVLSPGETASADIAWAQAPTSSTGVRATYLMVTPPNDYRHFIMLIPGGPFTIYHGNLRATAMARHTPF